MKKNLTRRSFLRSGLAGTASIAAAAAAPAAMAASQGIYRPGVYSARATGIGDVVVRMTFSSDRITDVVLDVANETPTIGGAAAKELARRLMSTQGAGIDAVSGATITSDAVARAAEKCIAQAKGEIPVEVVEERREDASEDWLGKEPDVAESDIASVHDTDILVVGCGTGGMFAIASAAEAGAKVIGIDRFPTGTGIRDDLGAIDSRYQKAWGTKIDKFDYVTMATQCAAGHINQDLVKLFCDKSGETVDWYGDRLAERGVELFHESGDSGDDEARYPHFATGHSPRWRGTDDGTGARLNGNKILHDYAVAHGARFDYNTRMIKLEKKDGRVTGCIAVGPDGRYVRYNARKGVVVATGGYSLNYPMMEALQPWNLRVIGRNGSEPGAHGDGIKACLWAGAAMDETHSMMMFDRCALRPDQPTGPETAKSGDNGFFWMGSQPWLKVNADGRRFFNESGTYEGILHADEYQKGHCHYTLFDSNWTRYATTFRMHGCSRLHPFENGADPNIPWQVVEQKMLPGLIEKGFVVKADSIAGLARGLGLPEEELKKTVERYNRLVAKGVDEDYGKEAFRLTPVDKPPFYGAKNTGYILCTMDGIRIDTSMNALDADGNPIPGLYVVGNDSGGYFANTYPNLSTGMACGRTVTFGRLVGKHLASL